MITVSCFTDFVEKEKLSMILDHFHLDLEALECLTSSEATQTSFKIFPNGDSRIYELVSILLKEGFVYEQDYQDRLIFRTGKEVVVNRIWIAKFKDTSQVVCRFFAKIPADWDHILDILKNYKVDLEKIIVVDPKRKYMLLRV